MPSSRKTRERQLAKLAARRAAERKRRRRQRILAVGLGVLLVVGLVAGLSVVFVGKGKPRTVRATPPSNASPSSSASTTPSASASLGSNCGYVAKQEPGAKKAVKPPTFRIDVRKRYEADVATSMGSFTIELLPQDAPCTVNSFVYLARQKFFDGLTFHRIVKDFVIQGGDPEGTGRGGPGYSFNDELANDLKYEIGTVAMANSGPNTNGSQWFVVTGSQGTTLPKNYSIFGRVVKGLDVVKKINDVPTNGGNGPDAQAPKHKVVIERVTIKGG
ncbi:MAG TPA: peptidylprolyl isomerase [Actinomycetota bacterium]|jgi:cyclophilin family peptidyl-prolyl cis-trans isomerase